MVIMPPDRAKSPRTSPKQQNDPPKKVGYVLNVLRGTSGLARNRANAWSTVSIKEISKNQLCQKNDLDIVFGGGVPVVTHLLF